MEKQLCRKAVGFIIALGFSLSCNLDAAIDWGKEGVAAGAPVANILQITPGDPDDSNAEVQDWIPCWGVNPWSYDGQWIVYQSQIGDGELGWDENEICIIRPDGTGYQRLTENDTCDSHGNFTPDGTKIVFQRYLISEEDAHIWIMDVDGSEQFDLTLVHGGPVTGGCETKPMVSPDGTKIAFRTCDKDIWVMDIDGENTVLVSEDLSNCGKHSWSPDSEWVLFNAWMYGYSRIFKVRPNGDDLTMLSDEDASNFCENWAAWSPDGEWISYHRRDNSVEPVTSEIWIMRPDGTDKQVLVSGITDGMEGEEWACGPHSWSPDSEWVTFKRYIEGDPSESHIFIINVATGETIQLTEGCYDRRMYWSPTGDQILFKEKGSDNARDGGIYDWDLLVINLGLDEIASLSGGSSTGCFIATAAFGSPLERHVQVLREFRNKYLLTSAAGRAFVKWYYRHSPRYAAAIAQNEVLKAVTRTALAPLYGVALLAVKGLIPYVMAGLALLLLAFRKRAARAAAVVLAIGVIMGFSCNSFAADANHFDVSPGDRYTVIVPTTHTIGHNKFAADIFYSYADRPLEGELGGTKMDVVKEQHLLQAAVTLGICEVQQVSIVVPYIVEQSSDFPDTESDGFGDLSVIYKYRFPSESAVKFAIAPYMQFDTGDNNIYLKGGSTAFGIRGILDSPIGENALWTVNMGYAYQSREVLDNLDINHSILFGTGLVLKIPDTSCYFAAEVYGRSEDPFSFDSDTTPVEGLLSYGYAAENVTFTLGGGAGIVDGYGASNWRVFAGIRLRM